MAHRAYSANGSPLPTDIAEACDRYTTWLQQQPLASRTTASYLAQVRQYLQWLGTLDNSDELLPDHTRGSAHIGWGPAARSYEQRKEADLVSGQEAGFWWILLTVSISRWSRPVGGRAATHCGFRCRKVWDRRAKRC